MKKLFDQLQKKLCSIYETPPKGHVLKRLNCLSGLVAGMIRKGSPHMADIGKGLPQNIDAYSKEVAAKRFVDNKWTGYEEHCLPFMSRFLCSIIAFTLNRSELLLVIDGSQAGKGCAALMVSIVWRNRGTPICWFVKKGSKGHFTEENHVSVFERAAQVLEPLLPQGMDAVLLGDGEFDGIGLQKACLPHGWSYVLRTASDTVFYEAGNRFQARDVAPPPNGSHFFVPEVEFTEKRFRHVSFTCWHERKRHEDPIFLISNLEGALEVAWFYDRRYSIECLFRDLKSSSFNLHRTRLKSASSISNLIIVAALAFIMTLSIGIQYEGSPLRKKVQRVRKDQKVLSVYSFACKLLDYLIDNDIGFSFSFQFSKNSANSFPREG